MHHTHGDLPPGNPQGPVQIPGLRGRTADALMGIWRESPRGSSVLPLVCHALGSVPAGAHPPRATHRHLLIAWHRLTHGPEKTPSTVAVSGAATRETHGTSGQREPSLREHTYKRNEGVAVKVKGSHVPCKKRRIWGENLRNAFLPPVAFLRLHGLKSTQINEN